MMPANALSMRMGSSASNACDVTSRQLYEQNEDDPFRHKVLGLRLKPRALEHRAVRKSTRAFAATGFMRPREICRHGPGSFDLSGEPVGVQPSGWSGPPTC